ncbi:hypothetical protein [uncultured Mitsuokella sp.]|uniref:hypothetical protein n=1 Tax=uncultured Mitsuokella sp. TaxID=453120 RepID=UPI00266D67E5|nr:hypothetical protein [uncultured Mitsuokella sp.]
MSFIFIACAPSSHVSFHSTQDISVQAVNLFHGMTKSPAMSMMDIAGLCSVSYQEIFRFEMQKCQQCAILVAAVDELAFPLNKGVMLMTNEELALLLAFLQLVVSIIALLK